MSNTTCLVCEEDYGDIADECLTAEVCADCRDSYSWEKILEIVCDEKQ